MEASQQPVEEQKEAAPTTTERLPFNTYREYFDDSYKVRDIPQ